ncbi:hypothetical protein [Jannaschia sp. LMIT008]|uniref:hypothetical protein n=1 Tax=Jannaschia maritima TaxID=3032585 RepID=UPI0028118924|nr:hypothetical protein [Jannaschia sp. LMIT008]
MTFEIFLAGLAGMTFIAVMIFLITSKKKTEDRKDDPDAPKSSLAKDGPGPRGGSQL